MRSEVWNPHPPKEAFQHPWMKTSTSRPSTSSVESPKGEIRQERPWQQPTASRGVVGLTNDRRRREWPSRWGSVAPSMSNHGEDRNEHTCRPGCMKNVTQHGSHCIYSRDELTSSLGLSVLKPSMFVGGHTWMFLPPCARPSEDAPTSIWKHGGGTPARCLRERSAHALIQVATDGRSRFAKIRAASEPPRVFFR